jgi:hypothetical protein
VSGSGGVINIIAGDGTGMSEGGPINLSGGASLGGVATGGAVNFVGGATILVKILMPTNKKGTRLRARLGNCARSKAKIYPWDYALSDAKNYEMSWKGSKFSKTNPEP